MKGRARERVNGVGLGAWLTTTVLGVDERITGQLKCVTAQTCRHPQRALVLLRDVNDRL